MTRMACFCLGLAVLLSAGRGAAQPADAPTRVAVPPRLSQGEVDRALFALGASMGRSLEGFVLTPEELAQVVAGLKAAQAGEPVPEEPDAPVWIKQLEAQRRDKRLTLEKERGARFAAEAAKAPHTTVSPSGLVYTVINEGIGPSPSPVDTVRVHYRGRLIDGREFDSSYRRGEPAEFSLRQVVSCWTEGLQKMKTHGKAKLVCPASIGYGDKGSPPSIPPGATLVFEVELLDVVARGSTTIR